jgi:hypothetical protein
MSTTCNVDFTLGGCTLTADLSGIVDVGDITHMAFHSTFAPRVQFRFQPLAGSEGVVGHLEISRTKSNGKAGAVAEAVQFARCLSSSRLRPFSAHHTPWRYQCFSSSSRPAIPISSDVSYVRMYVCMCVCM